MLCSVVLGRLRCAVLAVDGRRQNMLARELDVLVVWSEQEASGCVRKQRVLLYYEPKSISYGCV